MTPLAQRYFGQLLLRKADRPEDPYALLRHHEDLHCFDISAIAEPIWESLKGRSVAETICALPGPFFLPAPATWLECRWGGERSAVLIEDCEEGWVVSYYHGVGGMPVAILRPPEQADQQWDIRISQTPLWEADTVKKMTMCANAIFAIDVINTPSLIRLVAHDPHRGFERRFKQVPGSYPLHGWHEVTINPDAVREVTGPTGLCGRKCLHFVRKHRRRLPGGNETLVAAHWRGDPSVGMMRTRYTVAAVRRLERNIRRDA